jgi:hypothetical protein
MERRAASHTEEEELNQRRRLLNSARKGDPKAINKLFELYQVRVYSGETLGRSGRPSLSAFHHPPLRVARQKRPAGRSVRRAARPTRRAAARKMTRRMAQRHRSVRRVAHR